MVGRLEALEQLVALGLVQREVVRDENPVGALELLHVEDLGVHRRRVVHDDHDLGLRVEVRTRPDQEVVELKASLVSHRALSIPDMTEPDHVAIGTWSGGRFMRFGEPVDDDRLVSLLRPGDGIRTVLTADVYGEGEADRLLSRALDGLERDSFFVTGAVGHDFYNG